MTFSGSGAALYRLQDSVDGGPYATIGPVKASTSRVVSIGPSASTTHRFRVIPYDAFEVQGVAAYGSTLRVSSRARSRRRSSSTRAHGPGWPTAATSARTRVSTSAGARATYAFTGPRGGLGGREGPNEGRAAVYVDGVLRGTVDLGAAKTRIRRVVFRATWSATGRTRSRSGRWATAA